MTYSCTAQQQNKLIQFEFPVCPNIGVYFSLENSATGLREAHTNSISSLAISVWEYYTPRNIVMSCFSA